MNVLGICQKAKEASISLALADFAKKNLFLSELANLLDVDRDSILGANEQDIQSARLAGLPDAMIDRLTLDRNRLSSLALDVKHLNDLPDPVGEIIENQVLENGLQVQKRRVPLGVIAAIYESRPNVTVDISCLAVKSGNAVVLRGGSESLNTNRALVRCIKKALETADLPDSSVSFIDSSNRRHVKELLRMESLVDMVIPRGGASLHEFCRKNSRIPVITGGIGICHLFIDESADLWRSLEVVQNAKVQRPTVCNALDTVLVHQAIASQFVPMLVKKLSQDGVQFRVDKDAFSILGTQLDDAGIRLAALDDFDTEWLSLVLGVRVVDGLTEAIDHIHRHSTFHSDGILTEDKQNAAVFVAMVDSAAVYVNASTRFTDGSQLGLGAEVAISTQRLHARGPMGLRELTTYKWIVQGNYSVRGG